MKTIAIFGASGFIGESLVNYFTANCYAVKGFARNFRKIENQRHKNFTPIRWDGKTLSGWENELENVYAVINLSGENIGSGRWTSQRKSKILNSRVLTGELMARALGKIIVKPHVFIQISAVGFYGLRHDEILDEHSTSGGGFLAEVTRQWEASSIAVESMGIRRLVLRFGVVLSKDQDPFKKMVLPFRFFVGGPIGGGEQWFSWIHIEDLSRAIHFLIECSECTGTFNVTSPQPVQQKEFARTLGKILHRPSGFPLPGFILKLIYGQMAEETVLNGQRVVPTHLQSAGFEFKYPSIEQAISSFY